MTGKQKWQRQLAITKSGGICEVCGRPLNEGQPQGAHRIANTEPNRRKWGAWIIDHPMNIAMTCSLSCNQSCNIGNNPGACIELVSQIVARERRKYRLNNPA